MLAVYAIVNGNEAGWDSPQTLGLLGAAAVLLGVFLVIESRVASPLMPLSLFRLPQRRRGRTSSACCGRPAMFAWFFLSALYLQQVLGYTPLQVGLAFLPANLIMGAFSLGLSAKLVMRFGIRAPLAVGPGARRASGLLLFARAPVDGTFVVDVLPSMMLLGFGAGIAFNPVLLAAMSDVEPTESGLASGVVNTSFMMGGALGLAILASLAAARTDTLARRRHRRARGAQRRLPRGVPGRRDLRARRRSIGGCCCGSIRGRHRPPRTRPLSCRCLPARA